MIFNGGPLYGDNSIKLNGIIDDYKVRYGNTIEAGDFVNFIDIIIGEKNAPFIFNYGNETNKCTPIIPHNLMVNSCFIDPNTIFLVWNERGYIDSRWYDTIHCNICRIYKSGVRVLYDGVIKSYYGSKNPNTSIIGVDLCGTYIVLYYSESTNKIPNGCNKIATLKIIDNSVELICEAIVTTELNSFETNDLDHTPYMLKLNDNKFGIAVCGANYSLLFKIYDIDDDGLISLVATNLIFTGSSTCQNNNRGHFPYFISPGKIGIFVNLYNPIEDDMLGTDLIVFDIDIDTGDCYNVQRSRFLTDGNSRYITQISDKKFLIYKGTPIYNNYYFYGEINSANIFITLLDDLDLPTTGNYILPLGNDKIWLIYPVELENIFYYYSLVFHFTNDEMVFDNQVNVLRSNYHRVIGFVPMILANSDESRKIFSMVNETTLNKENQYTKYYFGSANLKNNQFDFNLYDTQVMLSKEPPFNGVAIQSGTQREVIKVYSPGINLLEKDDTEINGSGSVANKETYLFFHYLPNTDGTTIDSFLYNSSNGKIFDVKPRIYYGNSNYIEDFEEVSFPIRNITTEFTLAIPTRYKIDKIIHTNNQYLDKVWGDLNGKSEYIKLSGCNQLRTFTVTNTHSLKDATEMFSDCEALYNTNFDSSNIINMKNMFSNCTTLIKGPILNTSKVINIEAMFYKCTSLIEIPEYDTSSVLTMDFAFDECKSLRGIPRLNTSKVTSMYATFHKCESLETIPLIDTSNVINMCSLFSDCISLTYVPELDSSNATNTSYLFYNCNKLSKVPYLNTSKVTNMEAMYNRCKSLITVPLIDTSNVTNMYAMFYFSHTLTEIPHYNTSKVQNMNHFVSGCFALTSIPPINTINVIDMSYMFLDCIGLKSVPTLNATNAETMRGMFQNCTALVNKFKTEIPENCDIIDMYKGTKFE